MQFTKQQIEAITAMRPLVCVSAGAGSGKTTILIERIAHILDTPALWPDESPQLERIAAITFTDKAAAEMKARLRRKFRERPARDDPEAMRFWREMERQVETARITTIHSFCASLLREHALHIGMDPDWGVLTDADAAQLAEQVIDSVLTRLLEAEDPAAETLSLFYSRSQFKEGLTTALEARWKYHPPELAPLYKSPETLLAHWQHSAPLALDAHIRSFKGASFVRRQIEALAAFEGCCADPEDKRERQRAAYVPLLRAIYDGAPHLAANVAAALEQFPRLAGSKKTWGEEAFAAVGTAIKEANVFLKSECLMPAWDIVFEERAAKLTCDFHQVSESVMRAYADARQTRAAIDFDDMINETLRLLRENEPLRQRVARSFRFLLIDEFQDTDARQLEVAHLLADVEGGPHLFIVGDAKQSIYLFRGAEVSLFKEERERDPHAVSLPVNYRSLPDVICFINDFFRKSNVLAAVEDYAPMEVSRPPMNAPRVELFVPEQDDPDKREPTALANEREARYIARRIREMCDGPKPLQVADGSSDALRPATYDDIVLLFRRGSHIYTYEAALREAGVPYNRIAGEGFFKRREIEDMLALLKLIQDPWDQEALLTVLRSPLAALSDENLMRMATTAEGLAATFHSNAVPEHFDETPALETARNRFKRLYATREMPPGALLRVILEETRIEAVLLSQHLGLQRVSNLRKMLQLADEFAHGRPGTLAEFTRYLDEVSVREIREGDAMLQSKGMGAVTLMTIHKSKGLEFPVVFLPEMWVPDKGTSRDLTLQYGAYGVTVKTPDEDGELKHTVMGALIQRLRRQEDVAEMARILYVAMTRARDYLVLCGRAAPGKNTWAETLNDVYDLEGLEHNAVLSGHRWQALLKRHAPEAPQKRLQKTDAPTVDVETIRNAIGPVVQQPGIRESISVSRLLQLMAGDGLDDADIEPEPRPETMETEAEPINTSRDMAMSRGTLMHRLFELWDFKNDALPDLDALLDEAALGLAHRPQLKATLEKAAAQLRASDCMALFSGATTIMREVPFILAIGDTLVRGVVDAILDDTLVVDYKTGRPDPDRERHYTDQLLLYAAALRNINGKAPERAMLWYVDHGVAHTIDVANAAIEDTLDRAKGALA